MRKIFLSIALLLLIAATASAQCAMCQRVAETGLDNKNKETAAKGLNHGILYLLSIPYLIGGIGAAAWWVNKKKNQQ